MHLISSSLFKFGFFWPVDHLIAMPVIDQLEKNSKKNNGREEDTEMTFNHPHCPEIFQTVWTVSRFLLIFKWSTFLQEGAASNKGLVVSLALPNKTAMLHWNKWEHNFCKYPTSHLIRLYIGNASSGQNVRDCIWETYDKCSREGNCTVSQFCWWN